MNATFCSWLATQRDSNGSVGDLARDIALDPAFPRGESVTWPVIEQHLLAHDACDGAMRAARTAWTRYFLITHD